MRTVHILGSTGSIGTQGLDIIRRHRDRFGVASLGAGGSNLELLADQAHEFDVPLVGIADESRVDDFVAAWRARYSRGVPEVVSGPTAMAELSRLAGENDVVLNGVTGSVGLAPTLATLRTGATLALANKESLVAGGGLIKEAMVRPGQIVPVDSEHSAIAQALRSGRHNKGLTSPVVDGTSEVRRLILTASGGPFRGWSRDQLATVTAKQALNHPTWSMGPVVTINSSTLINKGLELIEAAYLFDVDPQDIVPVVHPQSVVHSMVEFIDGSTIAQASPPDMRLPIALGLGWPERLDNVAAPCSWEESTAWTFEPIDHEVFPALNLARAAVAASPLHPAVLNAANEEAVDAFLAGQIPYLGIIDTITAVLDSFEAPSESSYEVVLDTEAWARRAAHRVMDTHA